MSSKKTVLLFYICMKAVQATPSHAAAYNTAPEIVQEIVYLREQDTNQETPLHSATMCGNTKEMQELIDLNAHVEARDYYHRTPLHSAVVSGQLEALRKLLNNGANLEAQAILQQTALHFAVLFGRLDVVQELIARGAHIDAQDLIQGTPLHWAVTRGFLKIVRTLVQAGANSYAQNEQRYTALDLALSFNNQAIVDYLKDLPRLTAALQKAIQHHNRAIIQDLICQGAPLVETQGHSIFENIIGGYNLAQPTEDDTFTREVVQHIGQMADGIRNGVGQTALHIAALRGNCRIAKYLVRHGGSQINARDHAGNTPLHYATTIKMRNDLIDLGANPQLINFDGETALSRNFNLWQHALQEFTHREQAPQ